MFIDIKVLQNDSILPYLEKGEKEVDIPDGPFAKALREHCRQEDLSPPLFVACNFVQGFGVEVRYGDGKSSKVQPQKSQEVTKERAAYLALSELGVSTAKVAMKNLTGSFASTLSIHSLFLAFFVSISTPILSYLVSAIMQKREYKPRHF